MLWGSDLDGVATLAKARHADMLADATRWQRLRQLVLGPYLQEQPREAYPAQRSLQHS